MQYALNIIVYSHHFVVTGYTRDIKKLILEYISEFILFDRITKWNGDVVNEKKCVFAASTATQLEYRLHINCFKDFLNFMAKNGYHERIFNIEYAPLPEIYKTVLPLLPTAKPRPNQVPLIEHLCRPDLKTKLAVLQMGGGKTFSSLYAMHLLGQRFVISIRPMYIKRWIDALVLESEKILDISPKDIRVIQGTSQLIKLIDDAKLDLVTESIIIISNRTMQLFYNHYKTTDMDTSFYGIAPHEFYPLLKANRLIDEVHQDFHLNFIQDLYTHTGGCVIDLSATMKSDIPFIRRMYNWRFPPICRYVDENYDKYILAVPLLYRIKDTQRIRFLSKGRQSYSHNEFEKSIMKYKPMLQSYLNLVNEALKHLYFVDEYEKGQKAVIYAGMVEMCDTIRAYLQELYPDFKVIKYTSGDKYEELKNSDIIVTTIGMAGTAVDIADIRVNLSTTAISKRETNEQLMGRCRRSKQWPKLTPIFAYLVCEDIPKHVSYHRKKLQFLEPYIIGSKTTFMDCGL